MSDTPAAKPVKAAAKAAKVFEAPFEAFAIPTPEVPAAFREFAEKTLNDSKEAYSKFKTAAEEATEALEDSFETARAGALEFGHKTLDATKANSDAFFAFAKELLGAKTFAEAVELQTSFVRKQAETFTAQAKDFQEFTQKFATAASRPVKETVEKALKNTKLN